METKDKKHKVQNIVVPEHVFQAVYKYVYERVKEIEIGKYDDATKKVLRRKMWLVASKVHGKERYYQKLHDKVRKKVREAIFPGKDAVVRAMGFRPCRKNGRMTPMMKSRFVKGRVTLGSKSEKEEDNDFLQSIPYSVRGRCRNLVLLEMLNGVNDRLLKYFDKYMRGKTSKHDGVSLGFTCLSGGPHARDGYSGSYHANQAIWWSWDAHEKNVHTDRNAYGACFSMTPKSYRGGELVLENNGVQCKHLIEKGDVVGGRWSRSPHFIDGCDENESRNVFVMYGDYRFLERETYKHVHNVNTNTLQLN